MNYSELYPLFKDIIREFNLKGELKEIFCISTGNINDTYVAKTDDDGSEKQYIIQRVNHNVFTSPQKIAENVFRVTAHIEKKLIEAGETDIRRKVIRYYKKDDGSFFYNSTKGNYWRVLSYVYDSESINFTDLPHLCEAGIAFGEFQNHLSDFPAETLHETIPNFHNTAKRYEALRVAAAEDKLGRLPEVKAEYDYLISMEKEAVLFTELCEKGELPLRVVHNDTKCNNVMFDLETGEHLAVIDLDTVMPGLVAHDFGDAVRFAANPGGEDNDDISQVYLDLELYSAFTQGFVPCLMGKLTDKEIQTLPDGVLSITLELAARFLTDYLEGDTYFKCKKPFHNLIRTRAQIALAKDIHAKMPEMRARLDSITNSFNC